MAVQPSFLHPDAHAYVERTLATPSGALAGILARVGETAARERQPAVSAQTGALLRTLVAASGGGRVLEVGTNLGYSGLWMADALAPGGILDTIEVDAKTAERARAHFGEAGVADRVRVHEGAALDVLPGLDGAYDLVFLDAVKAEYPAYLDHARRLLRTGGIVAADNVFWQGSAWEPGDRDADTEALRAYVARVREAPWVTSIVPVGDGLAVSVAGK